MSESDSIEKFLERIKKIHAEFLDFLDDEENSEASFENLNKILDETKIRDFQHDIRLILRILVKISNHRHRGPDFYTKIFRILGLFTEDIKKYQNSRIFNIFKGNKRILLFLIEEKILAVDEYFVKQIIKDKYIKKKYPQYFAPEIKPFIDEKWFPKHDSNENEWVEEIKKEMSLLLYLKNEVLIYYVNFFILRRIGENEVELIEY